MCRDENEQTEYFVKWAEQPYDQCTWELESGELRFFSLSRFVCMYVCVCMFACMRTLVDEAKMERAKEIRGFARMYLYKRLEFGKSNAILDPKASTRK